MVVASKIISIVVCCVMAVRIFSFPIMRHAYLYRMYGRLRTVRKEGSLVTGGGGVNKSGGN